VDDARGATHPLTPRPASPKRLRRTAGSLLALAAVLAGTVLVSTRPSGADQLSDARAKASQVSAQITTLQNQISTLNEQYNAAQYHLSQIQQQITTTQAAMDKAKAQVATDTENLRQTAVDAYIMAGTQQTANPLFATNEKTYAASSEYGHVAGSKLSSDVAQLTVDQDFLKSAKAQLTTQEAAAQQQTDAAQAALNQANGLQAQLKSTLDGLNGQIAQLVAEQQAAAEAAAHQNWNSGGYANQSFPAPPPSPGAAGAVAAATSQVGTPYVWGGSAPGGFDCSGLVMWAWGRAGVSLPHFSGAQMADTAPVPFSDIQPGDLIFYGPGGSDHVAMYVGNGMMVEATHTGDYVRIDPVRGGYAGIGRP
jgi:peptidoglycan DL-endopeptidase CwlO